MQQRIIYERILGKKKKTKDKKEHSMTIGVFQYRQLGFSVYTLHKSFCSIWLSIYIAYITEYAGGLSFTIKSILYRRHIRYVIVPSFMDGEMRCSIEEGCCGTQILHNRLLRQLHLLKPKRANIQVEEQSAVDTEDNQLICCLNWRKRRAAVLICLFEGSQGELRVILTKRSMNLASHPGDVALPGGKVEEGDVNDSATALREATEEIGLNPTLVHVVASLEPFISQHQLRVTPVVGLLSKIEDFTPTLNPDEVDAIFDVPLEMFLKLQAAGAALRRPTADEASSCSRPSTTAPLPRRDTPPSSPPCTPPCCSCRSVVPPASPSRRNSPKVSRSIWRWTRPGYAWVDPDAWRVGSRGPGRAGWAENHRCEDREWMGWKYMLHLFNFESEQGDDYLICGLTASILMEAASLIYQQCPLFINQHIPDFQQLHKILNGAIP
ncbi:hypothetical protein Tsubulata_027923 [Turnera subulata]|uniref:Nudix hydrolase domain-containing protein n=1 Tax=Turnera subulata TaxID=218843 RepID=A0A9Q0FVW4_9ROSI|nr:hypothetical protein Tsubulata_027923 [Turnera subulata]